MTKNLIIAAMSFIVCSIYCCGVKNLSCEKWIESEIRPMEIRGIVLDKVDDNNCNGRVIIQNANEVNDTLQFCTCLYHRKTWDTIAIGDTLTKNKKEVQIQVINGQKNLTFDYPCCDH